MTCKDLLGNPINLGDKVIAISRKGHLASQDDPIEFWWPSTVSEIVPVDSNGRMRVRVRLWPDGYDKRDLVSKFTHNLIVVDKTWTDEMIQLHVKILFGDIPRA